MTGASQGETRDRADEEPPATAREVAYDDLVRGYEVEPGRFVTLEPDEIEAVRPPRSRTIDIEEFVDLDRIDPVFFEKSYYLAPQANAERPYVLLLRAMARTDLVGIGRFVLRTKPHLVAIRAMDRALGLETLYFSDEVRPAAEVLPTLDSIEMTERELKLAEQLIEMLSSDWEPSRYSDDYREELLRMISERAATAIPQSIQPSGSPRSGVLEMMEALKASVEAAKRGERRPKIERSDEAGN
jgi:DNA end-binding protein Ku